MLEALRRVKSSFFLQVVVTVIVLSFVFWIGLNGLGTGEVQVVALVNGERITSAQYNTQLRQQLSRYGNDIPEEFEQQIRSQVLDQLITSTLMRQEAQNMGLTVGDTEIQKVILNYDAFKDKNGKFDKTAYQNYLIRQPSFEERIREDLLISKLQRLVVNSVQITDEELKGLYLSQGAQTNIDFVRVNKFAFERSLEIADADVDGVIKDRAAEIQAQYDRDKARKYDLPKKAKARHILKKVDDGLGADELAKIEKDIQDLLAKVKADPSVENFSALAKAHSEDPGSARNGGDLGYFDEKRMDPAFSEAAFALEPGGVSDIVRSRFGFHIILTEGYQDAKLIALEDVQKDIARDILKKERGEEAAKAYAQSVYDAWSKGEDLTALLATQELTVQNTDYFKQDARRVPRLNASGDTFDKVFALTSDAPMASGPLEVPGGWAVVKLKDRKEASLDNFESEKEELAKAQLAQKQGKFFQAWLERLKSDSELLKTGTTL